MQKKARLFKVPIVMDPEVETAYLTAKFELESTAEQLLKTAGDRIRSARAQRPDAADEAGDAVAAGDEATLNELRAKVDAAKADLDAVTQTYAFRALGRKAYQELLRKHPAKPDDAPEVDRDGTERPARYHEDTFVPELVYLACVSPKLSWEEVEQMFDGTEWNDAELALLKVGAEYVQVQGPRY